MFDDSLDEAWQRRYGKMPPQGVPDVQFFLNHRSVRTFAARPVAEPFKQALVAAAQSAATSSNLQLWSVISVEDPDLRDRLAVLCANQDQIRKADCFFVFIADTYRLGMASDEADALDTMEFLLMGCVDAALAAERMVCAAESLGLGICYIGALRNEPEGVKQALNLPPGTLGVFGLCIGWPAEGTRADIKPRLGQESVWFRDRYPETVSVEEYNRRMRPFYEEQGMKGEVTWSMRSGRRASVKHLTGREVLKGWLAEQGLGKR